MPTEITVAIDRAQLDRLLAGLDQAQLAYLLGRVIGEFLSREPSAADTPRTLRALAEAGDAFTRELAENRFPAAPSKRPEGRN